MESKTLRLTAKCLEIILKRKYIDGYYSCLYSKIHRPCIQQIKDKVGTAQLLGALKQISNAKTANLEEDANTIYSFSELRLININNFNQVLNAVCFYFEDKEELSSEVISILAQYAQSFNEQNPECWSLGIRPTTSWPAQIQQQ